MKKEYEVMQFQLFFSFLFFCFFLGKENNLGAGSLATFSISAACFFISSVKKVCDFDGGGTVRAEHDKALCGERERESFLFTFIYFFSVLIYFWSSAP